MNESLLLYALLTVVICYLLGAIPFGFIVARLSGIEDIRKLGSGNIGATNVWRVAGAKYAIWVYIGDIGKGVLAVLLAGITYEKFMINQINMELFFAICGITAVIGHMYPVYLKFRGGKGVNTGLGVVITLLPIQTLISLGAFVITVLISRYISLGSIAAVLVLSVILLVQKFALHQAVSSTFVIMTLILSVLVIVAHRKNIARIMSGKENKFSFSSNRSGAK